MERNLYVRPLSNELLQVLLNDTAHVDNSIDSNINIQLLRHIVENVFSRDSNIINPSIAFVNMFYDFIKTNNDTMQSKRLFIVDKNKVASRIDSAESILSICDNIIEDIGNIFKLNKESQFINIVGGKIVDLFSGLSSSKSNGDFDIWITGNNVEKFVLCDFDEYNGINKLNYKYDRVDDRNPSCLSYEVKINDTTMKVQLIMRNFDHIDEILSIFDFLHCCVGYDGKNIFWRQGSLKAIKQKNIIINNISSTRIANERLEKYINRGFNITYPNFILLSINTLLSTFAADGMISNNSFGWSSLNHNELLTELRSSNVY